ncbi:hypothetical protein V8G54_006420 [Vigna mungo]|uniref:Uncharacterized protein n=1 Tax=Vigna mungo TaxID=3915 RepID=A0AAQ3S7B0_VIGMU
MLSVIQSTLSASFPSLTICPGSSTALLVAVGVEASSPLQWRSETSFEEQLAIEAIEGRPDSGENGFLKVELLVSSEEQSFNLQKASSICSTSFFISQPGSNKASSQGESTDELSTVPWQPGEDDTFTHELMTMISSSTKDLTFPSQILFWTSPSFGSLVLSTWVSAHNAPDGTSISTVGDICLQASASVPIRLSHFSTTLNKESAFLIISCCSFCWLQSTNKSATDSNSKDISESLKSST